MKPHALTGNRVTLTLALALAGLAFPQSSSSRIPEDWSRFRGPNGSGVSKDPGYPTTFGRNLNTLWRTPVRPGKSSPVLTARHIFLTAFENGLLFTQCFDRRNGRLLWERSRARPRVGDANVLNEPASMTPVTDGDNVYVFFADFGLVSYDTAGKERWNAPLGPFTNIMGLASSPILAGEAIVVVADQQDGSYIAAFRRSNGEMLWKTPREETDGWATPVLYQPRGGTPQILTTSRGQLAGHWVDDGARAWTHNRLSPAIVASPVLDQDVVFTFGYGNEAAAPFSGVLNRYDENKDGVLTPDEYGNNALLIGIGKYEGNRDRVVTQAEWDEKQRQVLAPSSLLAIRLEHHSDGPNGRHIRPRELWRYEKSFVSVIPSPLLYNGILYLIRNGGILTAFDAETGSVTKAGRVEGALAGYSASPVAADGKIFLASEEGHVAVLRAGSDWQLLTVNELGEACYATPALAEGRIYLRTSDALYCFGAAVTPAAARTKRGERLSRR